MYHSIDFEMLPPIAGDHMRFNTYTSLHLVPTSRPTIAPPGVKTHNIEVPGASGTIDLTESLTPWPLYQNRTGSLEFAVLNDKINWAVLYSRIMNYIHGRRGRIILEDDPNWYYEGRFGVSGWNSNNDGTWSTVSIEYELAPYKISVKNSYELDNEEWLWDPFSFYDGVIPSKYPDRWKTLSADGLFTNIQVSSGDWVPYGVFIPRSDYMGLDYDNDRISRDAVGWMPIVPQFDFSGSNMGVRVVNEQMGLDYQKSNLSTTSLVDPQLIFYDWAGSGFTLYFKGSGTVTIRFRKGSL